MDYVPSYQVLTVKDTTQQQLQSLLWPLGLDMIPGLTSFVDPRRSLEVTKYQVFFFNELNTACIFPEPEDTPHSDELVSLSLFVLEVCGDVEAFGFGCCLWTCEDPTHCLLKSQYPASHRFMGMPAQNCPTWLSNPLGACAEVTGRQGEREGDYVKVS